MKNVIAVTLVALALGACGQEAPKAEAAAVPAKLPAGQYEVTTTVTSLDSTDRTPVPTFAKAGDKATVAGCVGADGLPADDLLAAEGDSCQIQNPYVRSGRMNLTLDCRRKQGQVMTMFDGRYTADGFSGTITASSNFAGPGDYKLVQEVTARKVADQCVPAAQAGGKSS